MGVPHKQCQVRALSVYGWKYSAFRVDIPKVSHVTVCFIPTSNFWTSYTGNFSPWMVHIKYNWYLETKMYCTYTEAVNWLQNYGKFASVSSIICNECNSGPYIEKTLKYVLDSAGNSS